MGQGFHRHSRYCLPKGKQNAIESDAAGGDECGRGESELDITAAGKAGEEGAGTEPGRFFGAGAIWTAVYPAETAHAANLLFAEGDKNDYAVHAGSKQDPIISQVCRHVSDPRHNDMSDLFHKHEHYIAPCIKYIVLLCTIDINTAPFLCQWELTSK
ncbi:hypothetical protein [Papillibacter cinnamivorans]|uniref:hypothetical protein n=1 Tax=Papillibacter cinnamivorans TaxID=100176 RepID=UPI00117C59D2|nr:hypothetical protein [Papillibacter cinnamivorans]